MEHKTITEFQLVDINRLVPYINNARTHSPEQINKCPLPAKIDRKKVKKTE